jgi:hypothetical protein
MQLQTLFYQSRELIALTHITLVVTEVPRRRGQCGPPETQHGPTRAGKALGKAQADTSGCTGDHDGLANQGKQGEVG